MTKKKALFTSLLDQVIEHKPKLKANLTSRSDENVAQSGGVDSSEIGLSFNRAQTVIDEDFGSCVVLVNENNRIKANISFNNDWNTSTDWTLYFWLKWGEVENETPDLELPFLKIDKTIEVELQKTFLNWKDVCIRSKNGAVEVFLEGEKINNEHGVFVNTKKLIQNNGKCPLYLSNLSIYPEAHDTNTRLAESVETSANALPFLDVSPLEFSVYDPKSLKSLLYLDAANSIEDNRKHFELNWEVRNLTHSKLTVSKETNLSLEKGNYHFRLAFRPNTFSVKLNAIEVKVPDLDLIKVPTNTVLTDWKYETKILKDKDGQDIQVFDLLYVGNSRITLGEEQAIVFGVAYQKALGDVRSSKIALTYDYIHQNIQSDTRKYFGTCLQQVNILDHFLTFSPLSISLVGVNRLLNDGVTGNTISIRIANESDRAIHFNEKSVIHLNFPKEDTWNSVATKDNLNKALVSLTRIKGNETELGEANPFKDAGNSTVRFSIKLASLKIFGLHKKIAANDGVIIEITNLVTAQDAGRAQVFVDYENFPNLQGNEKYIELLKTPIAISGNSIGIGTGADTDIQLKVAGKLEVTGSINSSAKLQEDGNDLVPARTIVMWAGNRPIEKTTLSAFQLDSSTGYVFQNGYCAKCTPDTVDIENFVPIEKIWPNWPKEFRNMDHILESPYSNKDIYIFKDNIYIIYNIIDNVFRSESSKINSLFKEIPSTEKVVYTCFYTNERTNKFTGETEEKTRLGVFCRDHIFYYSLQKHFLKTVKIVHLSTNINYLDRDIISGFQWGKGNNKLTLFSRGEFLINDVITNNLKIVKKYSKPTSEIESIIPNGWVICDGTKGAPDLRNKFIVGAGKKYSIGDTGGEEKVTLTEVQMPKHNHDITDPGHNHIYYNMNETVERSSGSTNTNKGLKQERTGENKTGITINYTGGNQSHENRPPYYALCYIMKL